jgi:hypothetical protein
MPSSDDVKKLIIAHNRRLQLLKEQEALQGSSVEPKILLEIEDIEAKLAELVKQQFPKAARRILRDPVREHFSLGASCRRKAIKHQTDGS